MSAGQSASGRTYLYCDGYPHVPKQLRNKPDAKAKKTIFVGYQGDSSNYRLYDPEKRAVFVSRDVMFNESNQDSTLLPIVDENANMEFKIHTIQQPPIHEVDSDDDEAEVNIEQQLSRDRKDEEVHQSIQVEGRCLRDCTTLRKPARYEFDFIRCSKLLQGCSLLSCTKALEDSY